MSNNNHLLTYTHDFFQNYLHHKKFSHHTILRYLDTTKLFFSYVADHKKKAVGELDITDFRPDVVTNFLDYLENQRNNTTQTRNIRLSCIRSFFNYLANQDPLIYHRCRSIVKIPFKHTKQNPIIDCLEIKEMKAILEAINRKTKNGCRDYALFTFMYNTGARVREVIKLPVKALKLKKPFEVKILGKEGKERICPLWPETAKLLRSLIRQRNLNPQADCPVFVNQIGQSLTSYHIGDLLRKYVRIASENCHSLKSKHIRLHTIRYSCAIALMQTNVDLKTIATWLGHKSPEHKEME